MPLWPVYWRFICLGTDKRKVMQKYDRVWGVIEWAGFLGKPSESEWPHKNKEVTILEIECDKKGLLAPNSEKLAKKLSKTTKALKKWLWNVGKLQELYGFGNQFLPLARLVMSVLQKCYKLVGSRKKYVKETKEARTKIWILIGLCPLIHANIINRQAMLCCVAMVASRME